MTAALPGAPEIALDIADPAWSKALPEIEALAISAAHAALAGAGAGGWDEPAELALRLTDDAELQALNRAYRGQDKPTNVLSFPADADDRLPGEPLPLGDIALAWQTVAREAAEQGKSLADHTTHLIVHGTLHVLGYDHETEDEATEMEALEIRILSGMGIADPYQPDAGPMAPDGHQQEASATPR